MGSGSEVLFRDGALALNHFPDFPSARNQEGKLRPSPAFFPSSPEATEEIFFFSADRMHTSFGLLM